MRAGWYVSTSVDCLFGVFTTDGRFVTGTGRSHSVENGFAWHPTLGTPYLSGSSVKGMIRARAQEAGASPARVAAAFGAEAQTCPTTMSRAKPAARRATAVG